MYLIDDTYSLRPRPSQKALFQAFEKLVTDYGAIQNVRIGAIKHAEANRSCASIKPPLKAGDLDHVTTLFSLREPTNVQVSDVRNHMSFRSCLELFYPGIDAAMEMIQAECAMADLSLKPWCTRKIILSLGDGAVGASPKRHFTGDKLPDKLLKDVDGADIMVSTVCVGKECDPAGGIEIWLCAGFHDPRFYSNRGDCYLRNPVPAKTKAFSSRIELLRGIADATGGTFYGWIK